MAGTVWLEFSCVEVNLLHPSGCGGGVVECHRRPLARLCCIIGWRMGKEDGAVVGVFLPLPSGPASSPLSILNVHFWL